MTMRLLPPATGNATHTVCGRTYVGVPGTPQDVPDFDAPVLQANGWQILALGGSGATAARPVNPLKGTTYTDTTVGSEIVWDGKAWRHKVTGAAV
jgi:hypothetical protein